MMYFINYVQVKKSTYEQYLKKERKRYVANRSSGRLTNEDKVRRINQANYEMNGIVFSKVNER
jgi:hypothetical protein